MATKRTLKAAPAKAKATAKKAPRQIRCWQDDPGSPDRPAEPVQSRVPDLGRGRLPIAIRGLGPPPALYDVGTPEFRYWVGAEALQRSAALWAGLLPPRVTWQESNGRKLPIGLDEGEDLNAYYDRNGLHFFHATVGSTVVYSGESPDVCSHELGHAVLDALRPKLWDASFIEAGAFHESFGDMSSLLAGLQLASVRQAVLAETTGRLYRTSRLSRVAEQLGWAIRQIRPDAVEADCLRNAVNSFFYQNPGTLPPSAPASALSSGPHSFSRVFTGGFLEALAGMFTLQEERDPKGLLQASLDIGALLVDGIVSSPVVPSYFSQIAAHMMEADANRFDGRYAEALKSGFLKHGILSLESANAVAQSPAGSPAVHARALVAEDGSASQPLMPLPGQRYGLAEDLLVPALAETKRFSVASASPDVGPVQPLSHDQAARSFVEDLFRRNKVEVAEDATPRGMAAAVPRPGFHRSHAVRREAEGLVLVRQRVDCGFDAFR